MDSINSTSGTAALDLLRSADRIGLVLSGGSSRCAFQIGVIEMLGEIGIRPAVCVAVSGGVWNAAAVAAGTERRLRHYWRTFCRMPHIAPGSFLRERSLFRFPEMHRRTFPAPFSDRVVTIRPRHLLPCSFTERRWSVLRQTIELGRLRAREVLLGEAHPETDLRGRKGPVISFLSRVLFTRILAGATSRGTP